MNYNNCKDQLILDICKNDYPYFFNKCNVVGVGLGYKIKNGFYTSKKCIKVLVKNKLYQNQLSVNNIIPSLYKNIETDVVETGIIKSASLTEKVRPTLGGYSIGPENCPDEIGSIGCLVHDSHHKYILSNNHILANGNRCPVNTSILQPGIFDGGIPNRDTVANLTQYSILQYKTSTETPSNYVDCAIARLKNPTIARSDIALLGNPLGISKVQLRQNVQKVGRTSELTTGRVTILGATIEVALKHGNALFKEQIATSLMTSYGDSGALLLDLTHFGVGLFFAQSNSYSYFNPINFVLDALNVNIVTD